MGGVLKAAARRIRTRRASTFPVARAIANAACGLEIGGPSTIYAPGGLLPIYALAGQIDNCNFATATIFGNNSPEPRAGSSAGLSQGGFRAFNAGRTPGREFIMEGRRLTMIANEAYDFVLCSHMLEHTASPLTALAEWRRVLRHAGGIIVVLPHRDGTFDHRRPLTDIEHLVKDFDEDVGEDDTTHIAEVLELHDLALDYGVESASAFRERVRHNASNRGVHHHVFDTRLAMTVVSRAGFEVLAVEALLPYHIILMARKADRPPLDMAAAFDRFAGALLNSPFPSDHRK